MEGYQPTSVLNSKRRLFKRQNPQPTWARNSIGSALAASIETAVIASVFAYWFGTQDTNGKIDEHLAMQDMERSLRQETIEIALEKTTGGDSLAWSNPLTGAFGAVTPKNRFRSAGARFCSELTVTTISSALEKIQQGAACCRQGGKWTVLTSQT